MHIDTDVKLKVYEMIAQNGSVPNSTEIAADLGVPQNLVEGAFERLFEKRLLVPEPGDPSRIRMAPPFSGIETTFLVEVENKSYYANCVWDAFGIPAALHNDGTIHAEDGFTEEQIRLEINKTEPSASHYLAHFAVPAAHWWDDIIFT